MKLTVDNIIFILQKAGGISVYWYEIQKRLLKDNLISKVILDRATSNIFSKEINYNGINIIAQRFIPLKLLRYLPITFKLEPYTVFHSSYYRICLQKNIVNVVTVHDFTYEYFKTGLIKYVHSFQKGLAIKKADGIICISEKTKSDLLKFYPDIKPEKIKVIYNGVSDQFYKIDQPVINYKKFNFLKGKKYILYIGDRSLYKNFNMAVDVLVKLKNYELVIVGGGELSIACKKDLDNKLGNRYHQFLGINVNELNILYNYAFCLLYPSSYEGFGIPIVEAMKAGCPVVAANVSSIPEVGGNACLLVEDINAKSYIEKILSLENHKFRLSVIEKGFEQSEKFSWDKCYKKTIEFYRDTFKRVFN